MKERVTLTLESDIATEAKRRAEASRITVSALVEELIRSTAKKHDPAASFSNKWAGKLRVRQDSNDPKLRHLLEKYVHE